MSPFESSILVGSNDSNGFKSVSVIVRVYRNLHKNCWSIKAWEGSQKGTVVSHLPKVVLKNCQFLVSEKGRQRVIKQKRKNVHAYVQGEWIISGIDELINESRLKGFVLYNPYKYKSFRLFTDTTQYSKSSKISKADIVHCNMIGTGTVIICRSFT